MRSPCGLGTFARIRARFVVILSTSRLLSTRLIPPPIPRTDCPLLSVHAGMCFTWIASSAGLRRDLSALCARRSGNIARSRKFQVTRHSEQIWAYGSIWYHFVVTATHCFHNILQRSSVFDSSLSSAVSISRLPSAVPVLLLLVVVAAVHS